MKATLLDSLPRNLVVVLLTKRRPETELFGATILMFSQ